MKFFPLVWAGLWRKKLRTIFTLLAIVVAFLLFGMLQGVNSAFNATVEKANVNRLTVTSKINFTEALPYAYLTQIEAVPGVSAVAWFSWFGTYYQDAKNFVFSFPADPVRLFDMYPEYHIDKAQLDTFEHTRTGAVIGVELAKKYGWKIGDRVTLHSTIWTKADGTSDWPFDIVGTFEVPTDSSQANQFFFNHSYFDEGRSFGKGTVGWYIVRVTDPGLSAQVAIDIDKRFENSQDETKTQTEKEFQQSFLKQIGDINFIVTSILSAVFISLLFATGTTMMQSVRERIPELAVLKTLGFSNGRVLGLVLAESVLLCLIAAGLGLGLASLIFPALKNFIGVATLSRSVVATGVLFAVLMALITGLPPALRAQRLNIVDALAGR